MAEETHELSLMKPATPRIFKSYLVQPFWQEEWESLDGLRLEQCIRVSLGNDVGYPDDHAAGMEHEIISMKEVGSSVHAAWQPILHF